MNRWKKPLIMLVFSLMLVAIPLTALAASSFAHARHAGARHAVVGHVASVEGVSPPMLRKDLKAGKTLLQIAGSKYTSANALATALLAPVKARLNHAVAVRRIGSPQAKNRYARLYARVAQLVTMPHPRLALVKRARGIKATRLLKHAVLKTFAASCKTTTTAVKTAFQAGRRTPLGVCHATNPAISKDSLVSRLVAAVKVRLDAASAYHPGLTKHESQILAFVTQRLNTWVTRTRPART
jgi:hypothetical protein